MSTIKEYLSNKNNIESESSSFIIRKHVLCNDGFILSVQASRGHYCIPRKNLDNGEYTHVEIGISDIGNKSEGFVSYLDDFTNYGYQYGSDVIGVVPIERVDEVIKLHGGIYIQN